MCSWSNMKLEGWSACGNEDNTSFQPSEFRAIAGESNIRVARKRCIADCSILCTKATMHVGYVISNLSQSQLKAASKFAQSLLEVAVKSAQRARERTGESTPERSTSSSPEILKSRNQLEILHDGWKGLRKHFTATPTHIARTVERFARLSQPKLTVTPRTSPHSAKPSPGKHHEGKRPSLAEKALQASRVEYQGGKRELPAHEVIQNSFHLEVAIIDLQLCDDASDTNIEQKVERSLRVQLHNLEVDFYLNQQAGCGRHHWNKPNEHVHRNAMWSRKKLTHTTERHRTGPVPVSMSNLSERGVVMQCSQFSVDALSSGGTGQEGTQEPLVACNMKDVKLSDEPLNPAFRVGLTLYLYPAECGNRFLGKQCIYLVLSADWCEVGSCGKGTQTLKAFNAGMLV